jgi:hypothetical protein
MLFIICTARKILLGILNKEPPLWSCGQSSWLQISGAPDFQKVAGLERGPLNLVSTSEEILGRKSSGSGIGNSKYGRMESVLITRHLIYPQKLTLTSLQSLCRYSPLAD